MKDAQDAGFASNENYCYDRLVKTMITLEPDVHALIRTLMEERGVSFEEVLNSALRSGLTQRSAKHQSTFLQKSYQMGSEQNFSWEKALEVSAAIEDEELGRKLSLGR